MGLFVTGCGQVEWPPDLDRKLDRSELHGDWKLDETTLGVLVREGVPEAVARSIALRFGDDESCVLTGIKLGEADDMPDQFARATKKGIWSIRFPPSGVRNVIELRFPIPGASRSFLPTFTEDDGRVKLVLALPDFKYPVLFVRASGTSPETETSASGEPGDASGPEDPTVEEQER